MLKLISEKHRPHSYKWTVIVGVIVAVCAGGVGILVLCVFSYLLCRRFRQRRIKKHKEKCFRRNHGLLLQQLISSTEDDVQRTKIFTLEELEKATNNFDDTRIVGRGGHGTVYKGILSDQRVVAIKKSEIVVQSEIEQFINEVAILSQINHRNVVKLFGCCLEAEVPLLLYEFISGGTLSNHLHSLDNQNSSLSFKDRLRIATEVAGALAYLHSAASISIFHRDVKSSNILLDHNYTAKVADFGASRLNPLDKTRITTAVQGTFGYLDPEYYHTGQLTEKSDVYSFGVILVELLTGKRAISNTLLKDGKNLAMHFISAFRERCLVEVLDARVSREGRKEELEAVARLALMCLRLKGEERPAMKKIEQELNLIHKTKIQKHNHGERQEQDCENSGGFGTNTSSENTTNDITRLYSLEKEFMLSINHPR